jgi:hypothetical protein
MKTWLRRTPALLLAVLVTLAIAALSRVPYTASPGDDAMLRLSWRTPGEYVEECRTPSEEELARQPAHMRREVVCEGRLLPYHLRVLLNGELVVDEVVIAAGARQDRPLYVYKEIPVRAGDYHVEIDWQAERSTEPIESSSAAAPRHLSLGAELRLESREVALITYDSDTRLFRAMGAGVIRSEPRAR